MLAGLVASVLMFSPVESSVHRDAAGTREARSESGAQSGGVPTTAPFPTPSDDILDRIRRMHLREWILVTTPSARFDLKADGIGQDGLSGLEIRRGPIPAPSRIPWSEVARIDIQRTHALKGAAWGAAGGAIAGGLLSTVIYNPPNPMHSERYALAGGIAGVLIGSWIGFAHRTEAPVYIAPRGPERPAAPIASSTPPDTAAALELLGATSDSSSHRAGPVSAATPAVSNAPPTPEVEEACRQLFPDDLMRVEGRFGLFVGRASTITPRAIEGLRPELPEYAAPTLRSLAWEQVDRLDVRRNGAVRGAVRGAAITTALTLVCTGVAIALEGGVPSGEGPHLYQFTLYFGFLAIPVGTVIGTVAGAANPYWQKVYRRP